MEKLTVRMAVTFSGLIALLLAAGAGTTTNSLRRAAAGVLHRKLSLPAIAFGGCHALLAARIPFDSGWVRDDNVETVAYATPASQLKRSRRSASNRGWRH
jgi:hypothetical protein